MQKAVEVLAQPDGKSKLQIAAKEGLLRPDLSKRGPIRSVFDGRYRFTRYFSPRQHNSPKSLEDLFRLNDVELFDLQNDALETRNLATDTRRNVDVLEAMNAKLNALLDAEVGEDVGQMLSGGRGCGAGRDGRGEGRLIRPERGVARTRRAHAATLRVRETDAALQAASGRRSKRIVSRSPSSHVASPFTFRTWSTPATWE
jgi:hypothetical protein